MKSGICDSQWFAHLSIQSYNHHLCSHLARCPDQAEHGSVHCNPSTCGQRPHERCKSEASLGYTVSLYLGKSKTKQKPDEPIRNLRKYTTERTKACPYGTQALPSTLNQLPLSPTYLSSSWKGYHTLLQIGHLCCS